ncbi:MAG TPA: transglutaminase-like domain-containing protein [Bryobacteraceae bacterium]|nr:transglutaminase-like domain-containing protein [Bryobacteraceae bacterium]
MEALLAALADERSCVPLDIAALEVAELDYPNLDHEPSLHMLDRIASAIADRMEINADGAEFVEAANHILFEVFRFRSNEADYYNPRNSFLNDVLTSRQGIPISLSVVYIEVARRLARPVYGVGLPGHFLVRYDEDGFSAFLDPYHGGQTLTVEDCHELAHSLTGVDTSTDPTILTPVTNRYILVRMLNNLKGIYIHEKRWEKLLPVLDLLLHALPGDAAEHRTRGIAHLHLHRYREARADLTRYLDLAPNADDRDTIGEELKKIHRLLATLN